MTVGLRSDPSGTSGAVQVAGVDRLLLDSAGNLTGTGSPAQFDASLKLASTSFVQQALGNFSGFVNFSASRSLTAADMGKLIWVSGSGLTLTLPTPTSLGLPNGAAFTLLSTANAITVAAGSGVTMQNSLGGSYGGAVKTGQSLTLAVTGGTVWQVVQSNADLNNNADFGASLSASGYQKLPGGLIIQWGTGNIAANNTLTNLALPIAWPNGLLQCSASWVASGPTTGGIGSAAGTSPLTQIGFYNSYTAALNIRYIAIGY